MKERFQKKKDVEEGRSCVSKCGTLLKTLIVWAIVAAFMIPMIYELYNKWMNNGKTALIEDFETITTKDKS